MTKKSNEIKEVTYLIGDRLVYGSNVDYKVSTRALHRPLESAMCPQEPYEDTKTK